VKQDTQTSLQIIEPNTGSSHVARVQPRDIADAEVLQAQRWPRTGVAVILALVQSVFVANAHGEAERFELLALLAIGYAVLARGLAMLTAHRPWVTSRAVTALLAADVAYVMLLTTLGPAPMHYERALFASVVVVYVANQYLGRRPAWRAAVMALVAFIILVVTGPHVRAADRAEELWSLVLAVAFVALMMAQAGDLRHRLGALMELFARAEKGDFSRSYEEEEGMHADVITRVGSAYNRVREQLSNMVLSDPLTGCLNRRGFEQAYAREVARSTRAGSDLGLLVVDLDHFKQVNDNYGHAAGDEVLRGAGQLLMDACRAGDIVARVGGEEFALLLPDTGATGAFLFATRLCTAVREHRFPPASPDTLAIRVTTSIGVASRIPHRGVDDGASGLSARADEALYAAKRSGRDRVRVWSQELQGSGRRSSGPIGLVRDEDMEP
jgi:diguanylate cyclase (GGDEF)-like protein